MTTTQWQFLEKRQYAWRQQLYLKGQRIKASVVYSDMLVNHETPEEAAENWGIPLAAIYEIMEYCQTNQQLLDQEAQEERRRLETKGVRLEPTVTRRNRQAIVKEIANLEAAGVTLLNQFVVLNQWNY
jgi:uncharacterized protein (DUF433 family)